GREFRFDGIINRIERHYRRYRQKEVAHSGMEDYLTKVMVEHRCPDCEGTRLRSQRLLVTIADKQIHQFGDMNFSELREFLGKFQTTGGQREAGSRCSGRSPGAWTCCSASGWTTLTSTAAPAPSRAASRSGSGSRPRSAPA